MKTMIPMMVLGAALGAIGCQKEALEPPTPLMLATDEKSATAEPRAITITDTRWMLVDLPSTLVRLPADHTSPWFSLSSHDAEVTGATTCNDLTGMYRLQDERLAFDGLATTRTQCNGMDEALESAYLDVLRATDACLLHGESLTLLNGQRELAVFQAK